jgi:hypothetical protein
MKRDKVMISAFRSYSFLTRVEEIRPAHDAEEGLVAGTET